MGASMKSSRLVKEYSFSLIILAYYLKSFVYKNQDILFFYRIQTGTFARKTI